MAGHGGRRPGAGRPKGAVSEAKRDLARAAREHTDAALQALCDVMADASAPPSARISAAVAILDRGHGKPRPAPDTAKDVPVVMIAQFAKDQPGPREIIEQRLAALSRARAGA